MKNHLCRINPAIALIRKIFRRVLMLYPKNAAETEKDDSEHLREALKVDLPDYMVPLAFVALDSLPLSPNGDERV